ncbi:Uncharacterised protein [Zhongshania aliphaticivorans]|uniref:YdhG-like domain-containing protein n=2 Tax=Zhongshania aliphaticivorans TaxID=1470434 RepID=A0A5S9PHX0_9GAMM|nr:Uncharacterised protein [Zhongshania aliphaticivorans]
MELAVRKKFKSYPEAVSPLLENIRNQIYLAAVQCGISEIEESVKWGEPSYAAKGGSPIRFDWKEKTPSQYGVYFNCKTTLVETFKEIYGNTFQYEGNRAILFSLTDEVPDKELRHCLTLALRYHTVKHLPLLGA